MKFAVCLFVFSSSLLVMPARADEASKTHKVHEMLVALRLEETTNRVERAQEERIDEMSKQQLAGANPDPDQKKSYDEFRHKVIDLLRQTASWQALEPEFVKFYSDAYSEEEIDGILTFYRSPVGRAMLAKTVELTDKSIAFSQRRMAELAPKVQLLIDELQRKMQ